MFSPATQLDGLYLIGEKTSISFFECALLIGLAIFALLSMILVWTRWGHAKPIWKCVALSVFAHILLGGYAYGTKLFFSYSTDQPDEPMQFTLSEDLPKSERESGDELKSEKPWEQFANESKVGPESVHQTKLSSHDVPIPKRDTPEKKPQFREHDLTQTGDPVFQQPRTAEIPSDPTQVLPQAKTTIQPHKPEIVQRQPAPKPKSNNERNPESVIPLVQKIEIPNETANDPLVRENRPTPEGPIKNQVQNINKQVRDVKPHHVPGPDDLPDPNAPKTPTEPGRQSTQWRSASWSPSSANINSTAHPRSARRLGDGLPIPKIYQQRFARNRNEIVLDNGGTQETEKAIQQALAWLSSEQSSDGSWNPRQQDAGIETKVYGHDRQRAGRNADTGVTGLVLLSYLGAGHSHFEGPHRKNIQKGLEYLIRQQHTDGALYGNAGLFARTYCHGMAMLALAEAYAITGDHRIKPFLEKAQRYTISSQNPNTGGWRYRPGDDGDMSQFGWQVLALKSAEQAGLPIPPRTRRGMIRFLNQFSRGKHGGLSAYRPAERTTRTMTAEAMLCKRLLGLDVPLSMSKEAVDFILEELPTESSVDNLYFWYYANLSLFEEKKAFDIHRPGWKKWNQSMTRKILSLQSQTGRNKGSFSKQTLWSTYGGRYYSTAMSALCLEVYYRYALPKNSGVRSANR